MPLSTLVHKWIPANLMLEKGITCVGLSSFRGPDGPTDLYAEFVKQPPPPPPPPFNHSFNATARGGKGPRPPGFPVLFFIVLTGSFPVGEKDMMILVSSNPFVNCHVSLSVS